MGKTIRSDSKTRVYNGKNGFTSTFTKNSAGKWSKTGGTTRPPKSPRKK